MATCARSSSWPIEAKDGRLSPSLCCRSQAIAISVQRLASASWRYTASTSRACSRRPTLATTTLAAVPMKFVDLGGAWRFPDPFYETAENTIRAAGEPAGASDDGNAAGGRRRWGVGFSFGWLAGSLPAGVLVQAKEHIFDGLSGPVFAFARAGPGQVRLSFSGEGCAHNVSGPSSGISNRGLRGAQLLFDGQDGVGVGGRGGEFEPVAGLVLVGSDLLSCLDSGLGIAADVDGLDVAKFGVGCGLLLGAGGGSEKRGRNGSAECGLTFQHGGVLSF